MKSRIKFIIIFLIFIFLILSGFYIISENRKKNLTKNTNLNQIKSIESNEVLPLKNIDNVKNKRKIKEIKEKLIGGLDFEDIVIEYRPKIDKVIVFYSNTKEEASQKFKKFIKKEGINEINNFKLEFIGLKRGDEEMPAGFGR